MVTIQIISLILLCIVSVESILWALTIYNHCSWAKKKNILDRRNISYSSLSLFSGLSGIFSFLTWVAYVYFLAVMSVCASKTVILFFVVLFFQIISIHTWHLISTYICIPLEFTPFMSKWVILLSNKVLKHGYKINSITLDKWEEMFERSFNHKSLALNFIDVIPCMVWTKDINNRYTFANAPLCKNLLLMPEMEILNKTNLEIAEELRAKGINYTFGEVCYDTDEQTKANNAPTMFREYGIVDDKKYVLKILKSPMYNQDGMIGTIGVAKDITYHTEVYNRIENLFNQEKYSEARDVFMAYKQRFEALTDY